MAERIAVVGAGQMGNGIAHVFAQASFPVTMIDVAQGALDRGRATIE
jgi:3-hydroxybutyryl-CoA dehydrogenase